MSKWRAGLGYFIIIREDKEIHCGQPHTQPGPMCLAYIIRYHWNNSAQKCEKIVYGGCRETRNNFKTLEDCIEPIKYMTPQDLKQIENFKARKSRYHHPLLKMKIL
ncbi:hypothetical protein NQ317_012540 [Molorchus minor]|uniref:BPTI/Kunitz inhibitor domain-containing protein n=1 Tax=Molorchus minor TaxID=1323400 RepID=A0ABQ9K163_9CUCU|nr:hypothetical protein NQ317_012540 [Molorchus minor]